MNRTTVTLIALLLIPVGTLAEPTVEKRDRDTSGVSRTTLRREPIKFEFDVPYAGTDNPRQRLDLYLPKQPKSKKLPVIVFIHGGGWQRGNKASGTGQLVPFVRAGEYAGVSVGYRLSDEAIWPAQIHDCKAAIRWVRANADKYGFDAEHIGVWGKSAGGHLVLMLGASGDVPELEGKLGNHLDVSSQVACVVNYFGVAEFRTMVSQGNDVNPSRPESAVTKLLGGPIRENASKAKAASPITYITSNDPPVLTVHGTSDHTVPYDQAVRLDATLRKAGVPSYFVSVEGAGHGTFGHAADDRVQAFFSKYLLRRDNGISVEKIEWRR